MTERRRQRKINLVKATSSPASSVPDSLLFSVECGGSLTAINISASLSPITSSILSPITANSSSSIISNIGPLSAISGISTLLSPITGDLWSLIAAGDLLSFVASHFLSVISGGLLSFVAIRHSLSAISGIGSFSTMTDGHLSSLIAGDSFLAHSTSGLSSPTAGDGSLSSASSPVLFLPGILSHICYFLLLFLPTLLAPRFTMSLIKKRLFNKVFITQKPIISHVSKKKLI